MIIPDSNLLVYAYNRASRYHTTARAWFEDLVRREVIILLPWIVPLSFLRLMTHRSVLETPMRPEDCFQLIDEWYSLDNVRQVDLGRAGRALFKEIVAASRPLGNLFYDAFLAALAREYRAEIHSNDVDFMRFPGLQIVNPLNNR